MSDINAEGHKITNGAAGTASTDFVIKLQMDAIAAADIELDGISTGTAQLASYAFPATGSVVAFVKTVKDLFHLDRTSTLTADGITIVTALGGTGRWIRMEIPDPSWALQSTWFIDPVGGNDENSGLTGARLKTRSEMARRLNKAVLTIPMTATIAGNLNAGDTYEPQVISDLTNFITWLGVPRLLFTGSVTALTNRNGSTGQSLLMTVGSIVSSWTAGDGTTSFLNMVVFRDDGGGNFVASRVVQDMGSKQAKLSPPINQLNLESTFTNGDTISIYDVPSLGNTVYHNTAKAQYTWLKVAQRWLCHSGQLFMDRCWGDSFFFGGSITSTNGVSGGLFSGANFQNLGARLTITGGYHRLINVGGSCDISQSTTFKAIQVENSQVFTVAGGSFGTPDIEIATTSTSLTPILFDGFGVASLICHGFIYGSTARTGSLFIELNGRSSLASLGHAPNVTGVNLIAYAIAGFTENVSVLATRESNDVNGNRVIGPAGPTWNDNRSQPIANLGSGGTTPTNAANIGDVQALALSAVAGSVVTGATSGSTNLGSFTAGVLQQTVSGSIATISALQMVTGQIPFGLSSGLLGQDSNFFWDGTLHALGIGTTSINANAGIHIKRAVNGVVASIVENASTGNAANSVFNARVDTEAASFGFTGGSFVGSGAIPNLGAHTAFVNTTTASATTLYLGSNGVITLQTGTTQAERLRIDIAGNISISNLNTGGVVHAAPSNGQLSVGTVNTTDITNTAVDNTKLATMATATFKARIAAGTGAPQDITGTQATTLLDVFTASLKGLTPASGGGASNFLRADGTWATPPGAGSPLTDGDKGDIVVSGGGTVWTIDTGVVTNAQLANMVTARLKGRVTAGTGAPEDLTGTQATTLLDVFSSTLKGLAPASGGGTTNFLRADGTWTTPPGTTDGSKGDITVSGGSTVWTVNPSAITNTKLADMATASFKGRITAGTGAPEDLTGTQATSLLNVFSSTLKGLAPASGGGTTNFLRADGTWTLPPGFALTDGDKGDIVVSGSGTVWTIDTGVVTTTKIADQNVTLGKLEPIGASKILGFDGPGTGSPFDISVIAPLTMVAGNGQLTFATGFTPGSIVFQGTSQIAQDNANLFWNDTNNRLGVGTNVPTTDLDVRDDANGSTMVMVRNQGTGTSALAQFVATNNPGSGTGIAIGVAGTSFTATVSRPLVIAGTPYIVPYFGSSSLYMGASSTLIFATGATEANRLQILSSGLINISSLSAGGVVQSAASTGQLSATTLIAGQVTFGAASGGTLAQDTGLVWDNTNKRLGVGASISSPTFDLHVAHTSNADTVIMVENDSAGATASAEYVASNGSGLAHFGVTGSGFSAIGSLPNLGSSTPYLRANGGSPLYIGAVTDITLQTGNPQAEVARALSTGEFVVRNKLVGGTGNNARLILQGTTNVSHRGSITINDPLGIGRDPGIDGGGPMFAVTGNININSSAGAILDYIVVNTPTVNINGATNITNANGFNFFTIQPPVYSGTISIGAGGFSPPAATLCIEGAPSVTGGASFNNGVSLGPLGLWVKASAQIDGSLNLNNNLNMNGTLSLSGNAVFAGVNTTVFGAFQTQGQLGFFSQTPVGKQTITGSRAAMGAAGASILAAGVAYGFWIDGTSP